MRAFTVPPVLLTITLATAGCGQDGPIAPLSSAEPGTALFGHIASDQHEVRGSCEATGAEMVAFNPPVLHQVGTAVCEISHLGRVHVRNVQQVNVVTGVQTGQATWTTANGDLVHATSLGTAVPDGPAALRFTGITTITGGTGRFASAGGTLNVAGVVDTQTGLGSFRYDGWIMYAASDRANR
jgi:hypothetical protein